MRILKQLVARALNRPLSRLDDFHQRHAGQECYIFGDGVSLKWMDLHQFADRPSILGSMLIYHKDIEALRVPYCAITEPYWFWPLFPRNGRLYRNLVHPEFRKSIAQNPDTLFFINISNYPVTPYSNAVYVSRYYVPPFERNNPFRDRPDSHHGTLNIQLSLAIYMGYTKAYLVGHDYTHFPSRVCHFYEKGEGDFIEIRNFSREFLDYAKQHIDLVTVTLDGASETLNYISYKDLTGKEPKFRENVEIVDKVRLESLATWRVGGGHSIF